VSFHSFNRNSNPSQMARRQAASRRLKFPRRSQFFIRTHNEPLSVAAMRVSNEHCSPLGIHG
jgi:hypothetical protein